MDRLYYLVRIWFLFLLFLPLKRLSAFHFYEPFGARVAGMGYVGLGLYSTDAYVLNPAGIAAEENASVHFYHERRFFVAGFDRYGLWGSGKIGSIAAGGHISQFGDKLYNELQLGTGLAHKIKTVSLGMRLDYNQVYAENYGSAGAFVFQAGGIASLTKHIYFAGVVRNVTQSVIRRELEMTLPTVFVAALAWQLHSKVWLSGELEKDIRYPERYKAGLEYKVHPAIAVRTGVNTGPQAAFFGVGFTTARLAFHYALQLSIPYGNVHAAQISYFFASKHK